jgi:hypothetical protein
VNAGDGLTASRFNLISDVLERRYIPSVQCDSSTVMGKGFRHCSANTSGTARHQNDFVLQVQHDLTPLSDCPQNACHAKK